MGAIMSRERNVVRERGMWSERVRGVGKGEVRETEGDRGGGYSRGRGQMMELVIGRGKRFFWSRQSKIWS